MRSTPNCCSTLAAALVLAFGLAAAVRADDPYADVKPSDTVSIVVPSADSERPFPPWNEGRYLLQHFDERIERGSHHVGNLEAYRSIYIFTTRGQRRAAGMWFTYRYEQGDSLAMLDQLYKAANLRVLKRATDGAAVKDLPKDRMLIVVPVGSSLTLDISPLGGLGGGKSIVDLVKIAGDGTPQRPRVARTATRSRMVTEIPWEAKTYDAGVGDTIQLAMDCQLTVKKIVPADEKHNILGWVEFSPVPAGHEAELCKQTVGNMFTYATVGTDPAFEKALAESHLRKGLLAPREMRDLIASRRDLERIPGPLRLEARIDRGDLLFLWTFDVDFRGDKADAMPKLRDALKIGGRLSEVQRYAEQYLLDLRKQLDTSP